MTDKNTFFYQKHTIRCGGKLLDCSTPKIMGILNVTPDSFYDGGKLKTDKDVLLHVEKMLSEGADLIDIGGMSSRPNARAISEREETDRVIPLIRAIISRFENVLLSVDTYRASVARHAVEEGASMINDISAGRLDDRLLETVSELNVPYILMHMQGTPENMQQNPTYQNVTNEIMDFFIGKLSILRKLGVKDIIIDPGFGFGKTLTHNYEILKSLPNFKLFELPVLVGISRKSMICQALNVNPPDALNGTTALHALALLNGANILRVHDVKEAKEVITLMELYHSTNPS